MRPAARRPSVEQYLAARLEMDRVSPEPGADTSVAAFQARYLAAAEKLEDAHGAPTLQCAACHQLANSADGRVPGAPHWHLAPLSMKWEGLNKAQLCQQLKDPRHNGNRRGGEAVIEHMKVDPLVLWAWNAGANRTLPQCRMRSFSRS